jgi:hypothetical protein
LTRPGILADTPLLKSQRLQSKAIQTTDQFPVITLTRELLLALKCRAYMTLLQNNEGSKRKSYEIMTKKMFITMDKAKPGTGNKRLT